MMPGWMLRRSLLALSLLTSELLNPPARATVLFPDDIPPVAEVTPNASSVANMVGGILQYIRINPQAWEAWLANQPHSKNIEDRRNEPPPIAPTAAITVPLPKELQAQVDRGLEDYLASTKKDLGLKKKLDRAYEDWANRNKEKEMSVRESSQ
jgi:hypothetical protein